MKFTHEQLDELFELVTRAAATPTDPTIEDDTELTSVDDLTALIVRQAENICKLEADTQILQKLSQLFGRGAQELDRANDQQRRNKRFTESRLAKARLLQAEEDYLKGLEPDLNNPELQRLYQILQTWQHFNDLDSYQEDDIIFMLDRWLRTKDQTPKLGNTFTRGIINANATGMGKTVETIAFLWVMRQVNPNCNIIWFTKTSLVKSTSPESTQKWHFDMIPVTGQSPDKVALLKMMAKFPVPMTIAINYEAVNTVSVRDELLNHTWDFMVIDEVHKLRGGANATATGIFTNTKFFKQQSNAWPLMLSGSIINNEQGELWCYLHLMDEERFPSLRQFRDAFSTGMFDVGKLTKMLAPSMFRRRKDEVDIKMPERIIKPHEIDMDWDSTIGQLYLDFTDQMWAEIETADGTVGELTLNGMLQKIHYQRGLLMAPGWMNVTRTHVDPNTLEVTKVKEPIKTGTPFKLDYIVELASDLLLEGENVVIASAQYTPPLMYIEEKIMEAVAKGTLPKHIKCGRVYGEWAKDGGETERQFQQNEINVLFTNIPSGAEGFNWQQTKDWPGGAANLIMCDDWWNPEKLNQLLDRVWRRGAENRVIIHLIRVNETVDFFIKAIRELKEANNAKITEHGSLRVSEWKQLLSDTIRKRK